MLKPDALGTSGSLLLRLDRLLRLLDLGDGVGVTFGVFGCDETFPPAFPPNTGGEGLEPSLGDTDTLARPRGVSLTLRRDDSSRFVNNRDSLPREDGVTMSATDPCMGDPFAELAGVPPNDIDGLAETDAALDVGSPDFTAVGASGIFLLTCFPLVEFALVRMTLQEHTGRTHIT